jgi:hypothetical protein
VGQILHVLVGYDSRPNGIQVVFYLATIGIIGFLTWRPKSPAQRAPPDIHHVSAPPGGVLNRARPRPMLCPASTRV